MENCEYDFFELWDKLTGKRYLNTDWIKEYEYKNVIYGHKIKLNKHVQYILFTQMIKNVLILICCSFGFHKNFIIFISVRTGVINGTAHLNITHKQKNNLNASFKLKP